MRSYIIRKFNRFNDLRFASLDDAEAERAYDRLYELAGMLDANGLFIENGHALTNDEIAYRIRLQAQEVARSLRKLQKVNLIHVNGKGPQIVDWKSEQIDLNSRREKERERQARYRHVTRDKHVTDGDTHVGHAESRTIETQTQTQTLLSLSAPHRKIIETQHPEWIADAITIATNNNKTDPKYIAGILRNWLAEGRTQRRTQRHGKTSAPNQKDKTKKRTDAELKAAREHAAKELLA